MHDRVKELRKNDLKLSQEAFGERLGVSRSVINNIERNCLARPEQKLSLIKLMCKEFKVNEDWILNGNEPKFIESETFSLDEFAQKRNMSDIDLKIIKAYLELDPDVRKVILSTFKNALSDDRENKEKVKEKVDNVVEFIESNTNYNKKYGDEEDLSPPRVAEEVGKYSSKELSAKERGEEEYIKNVLKSAPKQVVSASSGTEDINKVI